jgi:ABC-type uncharacterized transport system auxiliary subunit
MRRRTAIIGGVAAALGGCAQLGGTGPQQTFRLGGGETAPAGEAAAREPARRPVVAVERPLATGAMNTNRLVVEVGDELQYVSGARWEDAMPDIVAFRAAEALQATGALDVVDAAQRAGRADFALVTVLRRMQVAIADDLTGEAVTELAARLVTLPARDVAATAGFIGRAQAPDDAPSSLVSAIEQATSSALSDLAAWTAAQTAGAG